MGENRENSLIDYLSTTKKGIDRALADLIAGLEGSKLHPQISYALTSEGKRLRPIIVIFSGECIDPGRDNMDLALAFELLHSATLVHDDIIDGDDTRRKRPALHVKWDPNSAMLTGDALIALSVKLASGYGPEIIGHVADAALELCEGEQMDIVLQSPASCEEYMDIICRKSGSLFRAAAECGALAAGADSKQAGALACFGHHFGVAYQLMDDIRDGEKCPKPNPGEKLGDQCRAAKSCLRSLPESAGRYYLSGMADLLASAGMV